MIRINLLGQKPPKPSRRAVPAGTGITLVLLLASLAVAGGVLFVLWKADKDSLDKANQEIIQLKQKQTELAQVEAELKKLEVEEAELKRKRDIIDSIDKVGRVGGKELLDSLAGTVVRTDSLWLTLLTRKGNALTVEGSANSIQAVANFISQLKRSPYFDRVEIKESKQDERSAPVMIFTFSLTAEFKTPQAAPAATAPGKS